MDEDWKWWFRWEIGRNVEERKMGGVGGEIENGEVEMVEEKGKKLDEKMEGKDGIEINEGFKILRDKNVDVEKIKKKREIEKNIEGFELRIEKVDEREELRRIGNIEKDKKKGRIRIERMKIKKDEGWELGKKMIRKKEEDELWGEGEDKKF